MSTKNISSNLKSHTPQSSTMYKTSTSMSFKPHYTHIERRENFPVPPQHRLGTSAEKALSVTPIIRSSTKGFDPYFQTRYDTFDRLQSDEQNEFDFYTIQPIDKIRAKKKYEMVLLLIYFIVILINMAFSI